MNISNISNMTPRQKKIWDSCDEYWYIVIRYNSWANHVSVKKRRINKEDLSLFLTWCGEAGDNMYCSEDEAEEKKSNLLAALK